MSKPVIKIATRQSPLALWQANFVKEKIQILAPELVIELLPIVTKADKFLATPLTKIGGKALFVKELEQALLNGEADIAVHSMKDVPNDFPDGLGLVSILERDDPSDAFVANHVSCLDELSLGSCVGTSSLRRQSQLLAKRPDLEIKPLRGNVNTRLEKLDNAKFDAIVLATSGLKRLNLANRISERFSSDDLLPAAGQGALGIEARLDDIKHWPWLKDLNHSLTAKCITAERSLTQALGGNCQVPIASYAEIFEENQVRKIKLRAMVSSVDGKTVLSSKGASLLDDASRLGVDVANDLLAKGASIILDALR